MCEMKMSIGIKTTSNFFVNGQWVANINLLAVGHWTSVVIKMAIKLGRRSQIFLLLLQFR